MATAASAEPPAPEQQERIEQLWLDAAGTSGWLKTSPSFLDGTPGHYHFGSRFCGRGHEIGAQTLRALQTAQASAQPVRVDAETVGKGEAAKRCLTGVTFFAPAP